MTAVSAYAAYLRKFIGAEPETVTAGGKVTLTAKHHQSMLTVAFRPAASARKREDWQPTRIRLTRANGAVAGYAPGQLSRAVSELLSGSVPAGTAALDGDGT